MVVVKCQDVRDTLISRTITVVANEGLDKTTTKAIVEGTGINEVYIYRNFADKEDLLSKTFEILDIELLDNMMHHSAVMYMRELDYETRVHLCFNAIWKFMTSNREKCLMYIRYYYSPYFEKLSSKEHRQRFDPLISVFSDAFKEESNIWMILNHIFNVMLDFSVKVHYGHLSNDDSNAEYIFRTLYASISQYFKKPRGVS